MHTDMFKLRFRGYNLHMRAEASPHVDVLEFEKGREADSDVANLFVLRKVMELIILLLV